jgi:AraC-like DNA-binding protein
MTPVRRGGVPHALHPRTDLCGSACGSGAVDGTSGVPALSDPPLGADVRMVRFPARMRRAIKLFHQLTGLTAVVTFAIPGEGSEPPHPELPPPIHPLCARRLRAVVAVPCREQWSLHVRSSRRSSAAQVHTCPVGLRCCCVPLELGGRLVGMAKVVAGPKTTERAFLAGTTVLGLVVSEVCNEHLVSELSEEVRALKDSVAWLRRVRPPGSRLRGISDLPAAESEPRTAHRSTVELVGRALSHLHQHYQDPTMSLPRIAEAMRCNPRYLTSRFTAVVGERMHMYLLRLRVTHACRRLIDDNTPIKEIAFDAGFHGNRVFDRAFRRHIGVTPGAYRRIFSPRQDPQLS